MRKEDLADRGVADEEYFEEVIVVLLECHRMSF